MSTQKVPYQTKLPLEEQSGHGLFVCFIFRKLISPDYQLEDSVSEILHSKSSGLQLRFLICTGR